VMDEPFYAVYLSKTGLNHPGRNEVLASMSTSETEVRAEIIAAGNNKVVFVKNMAHHMEVLNTPWLPGKNIFLIREPRHILASYAEVINAPVMRDVGIAYQYALFEALREKGEAPIVMDTGLMLDNPEGVLTKVCEACGLPFDQRMLHWPQGAKPYDGVWAPYWYDNVHKSTGFERQKTSTRALPAHLESLYEQCSALYEKLSPFSLKA
jgi:hypothetical protein